MKIVGIIVLFAGFAALSSCQKSGDFGNGPAYTVALNECIDPAIKGTRVDLCFEELIDDSRCPANMTCIWQGTAIARFSFKAKDNTHTLTLATVDHLQPYPKDTTIAGYTIEFVDLSPYPGAPADPSAKTTAEVKITKN